MTILYTRAVVQQAAEAIGNKRIPARYFNEDPQAFELVDAMLKDAEYGEKQNG